jgi:hypothetical protein
VRLSMIWLVRILWFMLVGGWGRRRIQARLEAGLWPWEAGLWHRKTEAEGFSKSWNLSAPLLPTHTLEDSTSGWLTNMSPEDRWGAPTASSSHTKSQVLEIHKSISGCLVKRSLTGWKFTKDLI